MLKEIDNLSEHELLVSRKDNYGTMHYYPENASAKGYLDLLRCTHARRKTFNKDQIVNLNRLPALSVWRQLDSEYCTDDVFGGE